MKLPDDKQLHAAGDWGVALFAIGCIAAWLVLVQIGAFA